MKNIFLFILLLGLGLTACQHNNAEETQAVMTAAAGMPEDDNTVMVTQAQFEAGDMELGQITTMDFPRIILTNGYIDVPPKSRASVSVYYGGYVKGLDLLPGQWVRQGQLLFVLENPDFVQMEQDYVEAKAQLAYLKSDYERQKTLAEEQIAAQKNFLKAESDYQVQQARIEGLRKKLELLGLNLEKVEAREFTSRINIYSPISGFITAVNTSSGSYLNTSDVAVEITNTDHLHLELEVFEKDVQSLRKGQKITFRVPGSSTGMSYAAEVHLIGSIVEGENRVVRVHGHLENEKAAHNLIPGMYIEAEIVTESDPAMALPEEAVVNVEDDYFILVKNDKAVDGYSFDKQLVQPGRRSQGMIEVMNVPKNTGTVLTKGAFNLVME
ncbi:MAG: efflux RND transporter periplasmic adaptor subunit [Saprospiraceae bacterium]